MESFSERITRLRKENNMTQEELGKKVGLKRAAIHKMEKGLTVNPKRSTIEKLSIVFGVSPSYIMCITDDNSKPEMITPAEFKEEVISLLSKMNNISEREKNKIIDEITYICEGKDE